MVTKEEFIEFLNKSKDFDYTIGTSPDGIDGVFVYNLNFDTISHIAWEALEKYPLRKILQFTNHGKNVDHHTRIVGYFSNTSAWNRGKVAELKDRARGNLE